MKQEIAFSGRLGIKVAILCTVLACTAAGGDTSWKPVNGGNIALVTPHPTVAVLLRYFEDNNDIILEENMIEERFGRRKQLYSKYDRE